MKKFTLILLSLFGISLCQAEEVAIGLNGNGHYLKIIPGWFFLDNKSVLFDENVGWDSNDIEVYDHNLNHSTIHFDSDTFDQDVVLTDCRFELDTDEYVPFSQCYFNNDELYEGLAYDYVLDEDGRQHTTDYRVINQHGEVLYTFEHPTGYERCSSPDFYKISDDTIIARIGFYRSDYSSCSCYYSLKVGQEGSVAPIKQMKEMKIGCNPVNKGDNLIVTVGEDARQSEIIITSISGVEVKKVPVIDGKAVVSTSDLSNGLYIASQKNGASAKFIVK